MTPDQRRAAGCALLLTLSTWACQPSAVDANPTSTPPVVPADAMPPPSAEAAPTGAPKLRSVYVPAYSHLPHGHQANQTSQLSILLSVRNVDTQATVSVTHVDYFNTEGHLVRRYLDAPRRLRPLETAEFTVSTTDTSGGSGANFLVHWEGPSDAHPLLAEAVMVAYLGVGYVAFSSRGIELDRRVPPAPTITPPPPSQQ